MLDFMSECPVDPSGGEASRPPGGSAGPSRLFAVPELSPEECRASLGRLRDRARADAKLAARFGLLGRYDVPDGEDRGVDLFEALVFQDTSELNDSGWLDRVEAIGRLESRLAAMKAETIVGYEAALHGVSADLGHRYPEPGDRAAEPGERRWVAGDLRSTADEIALALQLHKGAATARIHTSCELVHNFPATLRALEAGELTERAAFSIVRELSVLDEVDALRAAETAVLDWTKKHPLQKIKQQAQREAARRSPTARSKAHARAMDERSVRIFPTSDGTAELIHTQDAIDAGAVMDSLTRAATYLRRHGDTRSLDQLRADIALARLLPRTKAANHDRCGSPSVDASSAVDAGAADSAGAADGTAVSGGDAACDDGTSRSGLLGDRVGDDSVPDLLDDAVIGADTTVIIHATGAEIRALINGENSTGGEAEHYGPIPQDSLRKHLIRALSRTLLSRPPNDAAQDTSGGVAAGSTGPRAPGASSSRRRAAALSHARSRIDVRITDEPPAGTPDTYTPTAAVDRYVRLRDRTCQFPGCNRPAEFADLDHRTAFAEGGRTTTSNLHCLCRHHHRLKHQGGWAVTPNTDGTTTWTSPAGRRYRTPEPESEPDELSSSRPPESGGRFGSLSR